MANKRPASTLYRIQPGDCLFSIARQVLGDGNRYPEIKALNGLTTDILLPGQRIRIPVVSNRSGDGENG